MFVACLPLLGLSELVDSDSYGFGCNVYLDRDGRPLDLFLEDFLFLFVLYYFDTNTCLHNEPASRRHNRDQFGSFKLVHDFCQ